MNQAPIGEWLDGHIHAFPVPAQAIGEGCRIGRCSDDGQQPVGGCQGFVLTGEPLRSKMGSQQAAATGIRRDERRRHRGVRGPESGALHGRQAHGPHQLLLRQAHQLAQPCDHADGADQSRHVVPDMAAGRCHSQCATQPALNLMGQYQCVQEVGAGDHMQFRIRQQRGNGRCRRVDDGLDVCVVIGMQADAQSIDQGRPHRVQTRGATDHTAGAAAGQCRETGQRLIDTGMRSASVCATDPVEKGARRLMAHRGRYVAPGCAFNKAGECPCGRGAVGLKLVVEARHHDVSLKRRPVTGSLRSQLCSILRTTWRNKEQCSWRAVCVSTLQCVGEESYRHLGGPGAQGGVTPMENPDTAG